MFDLYNLIEKFDLYKIIEPAGKTMSTALRKIGNILVPFDEEAYLKEVEWAKEAFQPYIPKYDEFLKKELTHYWAACNIQRKMMNGYKKLEKDDCTGILKWISKVSSEMDEFLSAWGLLLPQYLEELVSSYGAAKTETKAEARN